MARLIDADALCQGKFQESDSDYKIGWNDALDAATTQAPTVDAYTGEQVEGIVRQVDKDERELRKQVAWLKSCINCKIRKDCPRHGAKVVHGCDHWEYGDPMTHGRWIPVPSSDMMTGKAYKCSECKKMRYGSFQPPYCAICGAKMDGGTNGKA